MNPIRVTVWNENHHERHEPAIAAVYPDGIHGAIAEGLRAYPGFAVRTATMDMPGFGLTEAVLDDTDVLIWWSHKRNADIPDALAEQIQQRVLDGMGLIVLHSGRNSKPFRRLMGTTCRAKWREAEEFERLWVIEPGHPIAAGLPEYIELPHEEMYGERCDLPSPDELVFIGWYAGGEVCRSGCCWRRGAGKIFYFQPGHETQPIYYRGDIRQILANAVEWAKPASGPVPTMGKFAPLNLQPLRASGMN